MKSIRALIALGLLLASAQATAAHVTLSARWDGTEPLLAPLPGTCPGAGDLGYRQFAPLQVSASGTYHFSDAADDLPGDLLIAVYAGSFDPGNLLETFGQGGSMTLVAGQSYVVVAQHWCENLFPGAFAVSVTGPGDVSGTDVVASPAWTLGALDGADPQAVFSGISQRYEVSEPVTVPATGLYWFADVSVFDRLDMELRVYQGSFDPADTDAGLVARLDDSGDLLLQAGKTYRFVVTAFIAGNSGDWHWVLFPPGPLGFNAGLNGAWLNLATLGQGVLLDVFTELRLVFLAWFTFDLERPGAGAGPMIGDDGHRWFTAFGNYAEGDSSVTLAIENTTGGVFDSADPPVEQLSPYGTIELEFSDCLTGTLTYDIPAGPASGVIPLTRIAGDHLALCAHLGSAGPGVINQ